MKKIGIGAALLCAAAVVAVLVIAATGPDTFSVRRSITIKARPETIAAQIIDLHRWRAWSPYEQYDPAMKRTYRGPASGRGAVYEWKGNSNIGAGRMEIMEVMPSRISIKLDFFEPMEGHNTADFTFEPEGAATRVTWEMHGPNRFIGKIIHLFINMDAMIGRDFEKGLRNLKSLAEK